ncbi:MAG: DMT family transporter [Ferruginibacter sp.]|nr:DMT family transporter [Bacteroidota bacterium]MBX2919593.1 DMT family transporter [Ferruginibacter sp.]MCC7378735.1 DMT family transporter [Chitinophagaceae bacterium]
MKKALIQLHVAVFLAGFTAILGKLITLNEGLLVWFRLFITVVTLGAILVYKKQLMRIPFNDMLKIFGVGVIVALHWVTFYGSVKYANVSVALVCFSATGFFTALFEPVILKRKLSVVEILLGLLAILGIYIIFDFHPQYKLGIVFGLLSAVGSALFPIFNKKLLHTYSPKILTLYELGGGLLALTFIVPVYLIFFPAVYYAPTTTDWLWLLVLAWFCTVLSFDLQLNALKKISAFTANLTYNLEPVYGIIMAFIFFKENINLHSQFYIGLLLIIFAVALQMMRIARQQKDQHLIKTGILN